MNESLKIHAGLLAPVRGRRVRRSDRLFLRPHMAVWDTPYGPFSMLQAASSGAYPGLPGWWAAYEAWLKVRV